MLRAFSTRRSSRRGGYQRLLPDDSAVAASDDVATLKRSKTLPAPPPHRSSSPSEFVFPNDSQSKSLHRPVAKSSSVRIKADNKSHLHPILSLFDARRKKKKKTTAKPEFTRYLQYLREGGVWDVNSNMPVIYYK